MCHQTVSLVARHLEANGIPTVVIATARDIVENCGVARLLHVDFPLGNPVGVPFNVAMQSEILDMALDLLVTPSAPRTTVVAPLEWPGGEAWRTSGRRGAGSSSTRRSWSGGLKVRGPLDRRA